MLSYEMVNNPIDLLYKSLTPSHTHTPIPTPTGVGRSSTVRTNTRCSNSKHLSWWSDGCEIDLLYFIKPVVQLILDI